MYAMIIAANWKAYVEQASKARALVAAAKRLAAKSDIELIIAPPAPYLGLFATGKASDIAFAAQDISDSTGGAATGEITPALLAEMGVTHAIIGHSERRAMGETDELILSKVQHALAHGMTPIVCIGEHTRDADATYLHFLREQIAHVFEPLPTRERSKLILAYEPIWAIGKSAAESITQQDLHEMMLYIRKVLGEYLAGTALQGIPILYGGAVEPGNIRALAGGSQVDGFLVGHASADVGTFTALVKALS